MLLACELAGGIGVFISALQWAECVQLGFVVCIGERGISSLSQEPIAQRVSTLKFMGKWQHELVDLFPVGFSGISSLLP